MTPAELSWEFAAAQKRQRDAAHRDLALAWQIERIRVLSHNAAQQHQPMPGLRRLLSEHEGHAVGTRAEQLAQMQQYAQRFGLRMRVKDAA